MDECILNISIDSRQVLIVEKFMRKSRMRT